MLDLGEKDERESSPRWRMLQNSRTVRNRL